MSGPWTYMREDVWGGGSLNRKYINLLLTLCHFKSFLPVISRVYCSSIGTTCPVSYLLPIRGRGDCPVGKMGNGICEGLCAGMMNGKAAPTLLLLPLPLTLLNSCWYYRNQKPRNDIHRITC